MPAPAEVYRSLRANILSAARAKLNLPDPATPATPWGIVTDWGVPTGSATIVAISDGTASIYLSGGGGFLGGGQRFEAIRNAAKAAVAAASEAVAHSAPATSFPLPEVPGAIMFYFLTDQGVYESKATVEALNKPEHPFAVLWHVLQVIVGEYRRNQPAQVPPAHGSKPA